MREKMSTRLARFLAPPTLVGALTLLTAVAPLAAQNGTVTGRVTDAGTAQPLAGAQVFIGDGRQGSLTDAEGRYTITEVAPATIAVNVRRIGYQSAVKQATVTAGGSVTLDFTLEASSISLSEVVVTATGEQRKREIGTAVSTIDASKQVELKAPSTVASLIQGNATGVDISGSSGAVGSAVNIKIRGNTSINLDNTPLVYVDGARVSTAATSMGIGGGMSDRMLDISPEEIESIEIVKGPAAATLYGTEAAAGVIRITTKQGASGNATFSAHADYGATWDPNDYPVRAWNPNVDLGSQYKDTTYYINSLKGDIASPDADLYYNPFRTASTGKLGLSMRGGSEKLSYYTSIDWNSQGGVFPTNSQKAYNLRGNFTIRPRENLSVALSTGYRSSNTAFNYNDGESWGYVGAVMLGQPMWAPIMASDPTSGGAAMQTCPRALEEARVSGQDLASATQSICNYDDTFVGSNNFARLETMDVQSRLERFTGSAALTHTVGSVWTNRFTVGYDQYSDYNWNMIPNAPLKVRDSDPARTVRDINNRVVTLEATTALNLNFFKNWNSQTTLGGQYYTSLSREAVARGTNFPSGAYTVGNAAATEADEGFNEIRTVGVFVQQQFAYSDRLFITPAVRFDRNSAFGDNLGSIAYPKISASWVASEEAWFPQSIDELRLRGALGTSGKQPGSYDAVTLLQTTSVTLPDGSSASGFSTLRKGNSDLKPERGQELELGFDASILSRRVGLEFTYFDKLTRDALVLRPLPPSQGFQQGVWDNVGEVKNKGIEAALDATIVARSNVSWNARLSLTHVTSEITKLSEPIAVGGRGLQEHREGYAYGGYFMRPVSLDGAGNIVVASQAEFIGQPTPTYSGSFANTVSLFGDKLTLYAQLGFAGGNKQVNYTEVYQCRQAFGTCAAKYERDANGQPTETAILKSDPAANFQPYMFLYDAGFIKLRTVSARFALPDRLVSRLGATGASISVSGNNLGTWTSYPGSDPEVNSQGRQNASQRDFFSAGQTRSVLFGLILNY
ncbi:MAG TPA: SusC/RagA family TonB-linked outer membrane protein [Gemmatimonadaceae bacterium]